MEQLELKLLEETKEQRLARLFRMKVTPTTRAELYREVGAGRCPVCGEPSAWQRKMKEHAERPLYTCDLSRCTKFWARCRRVEQEAQRRAQLRSYGLSVVA